MEATKSFYFYYVTDLIQKLPNKTQNLGPKSVLCRHTIENSQWSLLGVRYVFLKKKDEEQYNLMEFKNKLSRRYSWENYSPISVGRNTHKLSLTVYCIGKMYLYISSFSSL